MDNIRLIRDRSAAKGGEYFELLPGLYAGKCWNDGSLYIEEEVFGLIEPVFQRHAPMYDHYGFTEVRGASCGEIAAELGRMRSILEQAGCTKDLRGSVGFYCVGTEERFAANWRASAASLARMADELALWMTSAASEHGCISVLGI
jgi:hypothetical protein